MAINFNSTTPAAPGGRTNVHWQKDGSGNISGDVPSIPTQPVFADAIIPTGTVDGVNDTFTLPDAPNPASSLRLYNSEGRLLAAGGVDYTLTGDTIVYVAAMVPQVADRDPKHVAYYRH